MAIFPEAYGHNYNTTTINNTIIIPQQQQQQQQQHRGQVNSHYRQK